MGLVHLFNDDRSFSAPLCWALEMLMRGCLQLQGKHTFLLLSQKNILNGHFSGSKQIWALASNQSVWEAYVNLSRRQIWFVDGCVMITAPIMAVAALIQTYLCLCQECICISDKSISSAYDLPLNKGKQKRIPPLWKHMSHVLTLKFNFPSTARLTKLAKNPWVYC